MTAESRRGSAVHAYNPSTHLRARQDRLIVRRPKVHLRAGRRFSIIICARTILLLLLSSSYHTYIYIYIYYNIRPLQRIFLLPPKSVCPSHTQSTSSVFRSSHDVIIIFCLSRADETRDCAEIYAHRQNYIILLYRNSCTTL